MYHWEADEQYDDYSHELNPNAWSDQLDDSHGVVPMDETPLSFERMKDLHPDLIKRLQELKDASYQAEMIDDTANVIFSYSSLPQEADQIVFIWGHYVKTAATDGQANCLICVIDCTIRLINMKQRHSNSSLLPLQFLHCLLPEIGEIFTTLKGRSYWQSMLTSQKMLNRWSSTMVLEEPLLCCLRLCLTGTQRQMQQGLIELKRVCEEEVQTGFPMNKLHQEEKEKRELKKALKGVYQLKDINKPNFEAEWFERVVRHMPSLLLPWTSSLGLKSPFNSECDDTDIRECMVLDELPTPDVNGGRLEEDVIWVERVILETKKLEQAAFQLNEKYRYFITNRKTSRAIIKKVTDARDELNLHANELSNLTEARLNELHNRLVHMHIMQECLR